MPELATLPFGAHRLALLPLADSALQLLFIDSTECLTMAARARQMAALSTQLRALAGVSAVVPSFDSVTLWLARGVQINQLCARIEQRLQEFVPTDAVGATQNHQFRLIRALDDEFQGDLAHCAEHAGLSPEQWLTQFCQIEFTVGCLGFRPGFAYLLGLPERLACPRRATPRLRVPAGAIAVGGPYAGIYPNAGPGGWHVLGRCQERLFDPNQTPPCRFAVGDTVRFYR